MLIPELNRHLAVCGIQEAPAILRRDPKFWNVVSIRDLLVPAPALDGARKIHYASFDDIEDEYKGAANDFRPPAPDDIAQIFAFADSLPSEPILIHCRAGVSRSAGVAMTLLVRGHCAKGSRPDAEVLVDQLLGLRRQAVPNYLIMRLGLGLIMSAKDAEQLAKAISNDPRLLQNRFHNPQRR